MADPSNPFAVTVEDLISMSSQPSPDMIRQGFAMGADPAPMRGLTGANVENIPFWMIPLAAMAGVTPRWNRRTGFDQPAGPTTPTPGPGAGLIQNQPWAPTSDQLVSGRQLMMQGQPPAIQNAIRAHGGEPMLQMGVVNPRSFRQSMGIRGDQDPMTGANDNMGRSYPGGSQFYGPVPVPQPNLPPQNSLNRPNTNFVGDVVPFRSSRPMTPAGRALEAANRPQTEYVPRGGDAERSHVSRLNKLTNEQFEVYTAARAAGRTAAEAMSIAMGER